VLLWRKGTIAPAVNRRLLGLYLAAAVIDTQANFLAVYTYQFIQIYTAMLLDCFTIPVAGVLTYLVMGVKNIFSEIRVSGFSTAKRLIESWRKSRRIWFNMHSFYSRYFVMGTRYGFGKISGMLVAMGGLALTVFCDVESRGGKFGGQTEGIFIFELASYQTVSHRASALAFVAPLSGCMYHLDMCQCIFLFRLHHGADRSILVRFQQRPRAILGQPPQEGGGPC